MLAQVNSQHSCNDTKKGARGVVVTGAAWCKERWSWCGGNGSIPAKKAF